MPTFSDADNAGPAGIRPITLLGDHVATCVHRRWRRNTTLMDSGHDALQRRVRTPTPVSRRRHYARANAAPAGPAAAGTTLRNLTLVTYLSCDIAHSGAEPQAAWHANTTPAHAARYRRRADTTTSIGISGSAACVNRHPPRRLLMNSDRVLCRVHISLRCRRRCTVFAAYRMCMRVYGIPLRRHSPALAYAAFVCRYRVIAHTFRASCNTLLPITRADMRGHAAGRRAGHALLRCTLRYRADDTRSSSAALHRM